LGNFDIINDLLKAWDIDKYSAPILITALTASFVFRDKLEYRPEFYTRIKDKIGEDLVNGLE